MMGKKYEIPRRSVLSGNSPRTTGEGCWLDLDRSLEGTSEADDMETRWQLWIECYEMTVLLENRWLLSSGTAEEGI